MEISGHPGPFYGRSFASRKSAENKSRFPAVPGRGEELREKGSFFQGKKNISYPFDGLNPANPLF